MIVVVCDDTKTAVAYFTALKQEVKSRKIVNVYPASCNGATGRKVIADAKSRAEDRDPDDSVFVLIDVDTNPDMNGLRQEGAGNGIEVLFSNPCFEIWTLAHLQDTGEMFADCDAVVRRIKIKWKETFGIEFANKAQADYEKLKRHRSMPAP